MVDRVGRSGRLAGLARLAGLWCGRVGAPVDVHWLLDTSPLAVPPFPLAPFFSRPCLVVEYIRVEYHRHRYPAVHRVSHPLHADCWYEHRGTTKNPDRPSNLFRIPVSSLSLTCLLFLSLCGVLTSHPFTTRSLSLFPFSTPSTLSHCRGLLLNLVGHRSQGEPTCHSLNEPTWRGASLDSSWAGVSRFPVKVSIATRRTRPPALSPFFFGADPKGRQD